VKLDRLTSPRGDVFSLDVEGVGEFERVRACDDEQGRARGAVLDAERNEVDSVCDRKGKREREEREIMGLRYRKRLREREELCWMQRETR